MTKFPWMIVNEQIKINSNKFIERIQFLKQGPAYKKDGPDPNKRSNQQ